jgi:hypothetical protein
MQLQVSNHLIVWRMKITDSTVDGSLDSLPNALDRRESPVAAWNSPLPTEMIGTAGATVLPSSVPVQYDASAEIRKHVSSSLMGSALLAGLVTSFIS